MTNRTFTIPSLAMLLVVSLVAMLASAGGDWRFQPNTEQAWLTVNNPDADFDSRLEAEQLLLSELDARFFAEFFWGMIDDISVAPEGENHSDVSFYGVYTRHLPIAPAPELADSLPIEAQIAQARVRVVFSLMVDATPEDMRKTAFENVLDRALKLGIGQTLESGTVITEELKIWLLQSLILGGAAANWSPSMSDQLVSVVTDESLPEEVRASPVKTIVGRARFDPSDAASRSAADAVIQYAWEHRGQEFTQRITPPLTLIRDPRTALLLMDWAESVDPATATVQDAEFVVNRFDWYFDDVSGLYIPHGGEHPRDQELRQERIEVQRRAVESGDWSAVREFDKRVLAERRLEAQERHATIMTWIEANRMRLQAEVVGDAADEAM